MLLSLPAYCPELNPVVDSTDCWRQLALPSALTVRTSIPSSDSGNISKATIWQDNLHAVLFTLAKVQLTMRDPLNEVLDILERLDAGASLEFAESYRSGSIGRAKGVAVKIREALWPVLIKMAQRETPVVEDVQRAYSLAMRWKCAEQKAFRLRNDSGKDERTEIEAAIAELRAKHSDLTLRHDAGNHELEKEKERSGYNLAYLESLLASATSVDRVLTHVMAVNTELIANLLDEGGRLIDIWRVKADGSGESAYLAFHLEGGHPESIQLATLGSTESVDALVDKIVINMELGRPGATWREAALSLSEMIFGKTRLPEGVGELAYSPDGELWRLPLDCLPLSGGGEVLDRFSICTVPSGRDSLHDPYLRGMSREIVVFAGPDFDSSAGEAEVAEASPLSSCYVDSLEVPLFQPLPSCVVEGQAVVDIMEDASFFQGGGCTKPRLLEINSPILLHIATHGFAVDQAAVPVPIPVQANSMEDLVRHVSEPLLRCGLAFAGANHCTRGGTGLRSTKSAILWGTDVLELDVRGTEVVFLSACQTGAGDVTLGSSASTLAQAFWLAGARSVISTHWPVDDNAAKTIALAFYRSFTGGATIADALRKAKLEARSNGFRSLEWGAYSLFGQARRLQFGNEIFVQEVHFSSD